MPAFDDNVPATVWQVCPMVPVDLMRRNAVTKCFFPNQVKKELFERPSAVASKLQEVFGLSKHGRSRTFASQPRFRNNSF